jgi:DNA-binding response OmpR family regulator
MHGAGGSLDKRLMARKDVNPKGYVVVLEDDPQIRELLGRWLGEAGYRVATPDTESNAKPALVIANAAEPQAATALICSLQEEYAAPILIISARFRRGLAGSAEAARRLGVDKLLPKPFTRKELLAAVRESVEA